MTELTHFQQAAQLFGDPSRSAILWELFSGQAITAGDLAIAANITPQSASGHLKKLVDAGILKVSKQGRHRCFEYAKPEVAVAVETLSGIFSAPASHPAIQKELRGARSCYDHLAGQAGVAVTEALLQQNYIITHPERNREFALTRPGTAWFESLGILIGPLHQKRRPLALKCIDWSEKKPHIAGSLGCALLDYFLQEHWFRKIQGKRTLQLTARGRAALKNKLGIDLPG